MLLRLLASNYSEAFSDDNPVVFDDLKFLIEFLLQYLLSQQNNGIGHLCASERKVDLP